MLPGARTNSLGAAAANRGATRARPLRHGGRGIKKRPAARATTDAAADAGWFNLCACRNDDDVHASPGQQNQADLGPGAYNSEAIYPGIRGAI